MELAGVQPDSDEQWRQYKADLDAHRLFRRFCYAARASFGDEYLVLVSGKPIINNIGEFRGYRGIASNVTEAVSARHRAETAEVLLQDAVDDISDGSRSTIVMTASSCATTLTDVCITSSPS
jgi:hypothetical protein